MTATEAEIRAFTEFACCRVKNGGGDSIQELFGEWLSLRETQEIVQAIGEGEAEIEAGEGKPVDIAFADVRNRLGWSE